MIAAGIAVVVVVAVIVILHVDQHTTMRIREEETLGSPLYSGLPNPLPPEMHFQTQRPCSVSLHHTVHAWTNVTGCLESNGCWEAKHLPSPFS